MPKGIKRSHLNELSSVILRGFEKLTSLTSVLIIRPWSLHFNTSVTLKFMALGKKVVYAYDLPIKTTLEILRDCKVDAIFVTPNYAREMAHNSHPTDDYFDNLKMINCSGNSLKAEMVQALQKSFPKVKITQSYGSTECEDIFRNDIDSKPESMGRVRPGSIVKIVEQKTRAVLGPNQVGEICIKGPTVTQSYINLNIADCIDHDGFFKTGDLGYYDEDQYFYFVDRIANFIRWKNDKVSPYMQLRGGVIFIPEVPKSEGDKPLRQELKKLLIANASS